MHIIKEGDPDWKKKPIIIFNCNDCGCRFEAEKGEWEYAPGIAQQMGEAKYQCKCPCCGKNLYTL